MSDNRKYYYLKLKENYFDDDSIVLLESMQDGVLYSNILLKLYLKSLKHGGRLQLDEDIPYTAQMIATITRQQIGTVERALQIFLKLGLVEVLDSGTFYMSNIELLIGQSSTEAERKRAARLQNKALSAPRTNGGHLSDIRPPEIEIELEKEIEIKREIENPTTRVLIHEKSSLAPPGQSLAFSLGDEKGFEWIGAYDITADELLAGTDTAKTESKTAQAEMLILELLANGKKMPSAELEKAVNDRGISSRTMRTAKSRIGDRLITEKDGTAWVCYLRN